MMSSLKKILIATVMAYFLVLVGFYFFQQDLLFKPNSDNLAECKMTRHPSIEYINKKISGKKVRYFKYTRKDAKASLIFFHGQSDSACTKEFFIHALSKSKINIILAEYPGFGGQAPKNLTQNDFLLNAQLIYDDIALEKRPIFVYGESFGSSIATYIASKNKVLGLIVQHPYTSISEVAKDRFPFIPIHLLNRFVFPAKEWAKNVNVTPIIFQGKKDLVVPTYIVKKQVLNFRKTPYYFEVPRSTHNNITKFPIVFKEANKYISKLLSENLYAAFIN